MVFTLINHLHNTQQYHKLGGIKQQKCCLNSKGQQSKLKVISKAVFSAEMLGKIQPSNGQASLACGSTRPIFRGSVSPPF